MFAPWIYPLERLPIHQKFIDNYVEFRSKCSDEFKNDLDIVLFRDAVDMSKNLPRVLIKHIRSTKKVESSRDNDKNQTIRIYDREGYYPNLLKEFYFSREELEDYQEEFESQELSLFYDQNDLDNYIVYYSDWENTIGDGWDDMPNEKDIRKVKLNYNGIAFTYKRLEKYGIY